MVILLNIGYAVLEADKLGLLCCISYAQNIKFNKVLSESQITTRIVSCVFMHVGYTDGLSEKRIQLTCMQDHF